jgi:hypothetical protein
MGAMTADVYTERDAEWEYAPMRIPADVSRVNAAVRLALHAEYGGWELARVQRYVDGSRRIVLRRKRRPADLDAVPMPGLYA